MYIKMTNKLTNKTFVFPLVVPYNNNNNKKYINDKNLFLNDSEKLTRLDITIFQIQYFIVATTFNYGKVYISDASTQ